MLVLLLLFRIAWSWWSGINPRTRKGRRARRVQLCV